MIYLDNAATTIHKPQPVIDAVIRAMGSAGNASRGTHEGSLGAARMVYDARVRLARLFGCPSSDHVVFTANSTEALNIAINGVLKENDHVITTDLEHNSVLRPLYRLRDERGIRLSFVPADQSGNIDPEEFIRRIGPDTRLIVCNHASNLTGNLADIRRIGSIARQAGVLFLVDASQTAGVFPIDMVAMNIDILCFTGHKGLMGPQGTGGLCIGQGIGIAHWKVGGSGIQTYSEIHPEVLPVRLEAGTLNAHGIAGLSAALGFIEEVGMERICQREQLLMERFYRGVRGIPGIQIYGDFTGPRAAIVALNLGPLSSGEVSDELSERYGIATRPGGHCAPRMHRALGTESTGAVRFSFSWFNTEAEVDVAIQAMQELARQI